LVREKENLLSFHAVYKDEKAKRIYCDIIVDYELSDREKPGEEFPKYMTGLYPGFDVELTVETEYI